MGNPIIEYNNKNPNCMELKTTPIDHLQVDLCKTTPASGEVNRDLNVRF